MSDAEPGARQRRHLLERGLPLGTIQRDLFTEVATDQSAFPGLQKAQPQLGTVNATRVDHALLPGRGGLEQPLDVQLARDLEVQRRLDDVGGLDDPGQPALVLARAVAADVGEGRLEAERLQVEDRRVGRAERIVRARGDDERQVVLVRAPDGLADDVVPLRLGARPDEGLLQPVGEHDDLAVLAQPPPDGLALGGGDQAGVDLVEEPGAGHGLEVQLRRRVPQFDRNGDRSLLRQVFRQPHEYGSLARSDAADDDVRAGGAIMQVRHHRHAQLVAADDLVDDRARGGHELAGVLAAP